MYYIKSILFFTSILIVSIGWGCGNNNQTYNNAIFIENITTVDAINGVQKNRTVIIQGNKILKIDNSSNIKLNNSNKIIDGTGKFLIPGLWDFHVHFAYIEELAPAMFELFLAYGITSVRDTGGKIDFIKKWKNKADNSMTKAPRVMIAGPLLDGEPNVYDGSPGRPELSVGLDDVTTAQEMVDSLNTIGVDLLKAYEMLSPEQFSAITKKARTHDLMVTGHVPLSMDVISAVNAGLNSMEHMRNLEFSTAKNWKTLLTQRRKLLAEGMMDQGGVLRSRIHNAQRSLALENQDEYQTKKVLKKLAENNVYQIPTLSIMTLSVNRPFKDSTWMDSYRFLPKEVEKKWRDGAERIMESQASEQRTKYSAWLHDMVKKANDAEVKILAGTDCPIGYLTPGLSLHDELLLLSKSGMSNMEILKSATYGPAEYFNMQDQLGTIADDMIADLLILDGNPLEDIRNTQKINAVIKDGSLMDRSILNGMLEKLDAVN